MWPREQSDSVPDRRGWLVEPQGRESHRSDFYVAYLRREMVSVRQVGNELVSVVGLNNAASTAAKRMTEQEKTAGSAALHPVRCSQRYSWYEREVMFDLEVLSAVIHGNEC